MHTILDFNRRAYHRYNKYAQNFSTISELSGSKHNMSQNAKEQAYPKEEPEYGSKSKQKHKQKQYEDYVLQDLASPPKSTVFKLSVEQTNPDPAQKRKKNLAQEPRRNSVVAFSPKQMSLGQNSPNHFASPLFDRKLIFFCDEINPESNYPNVRYYFSCCVIGKKFFLIGGIGNTDNDVWEYDIEENVWKSWGLESFFLNRYGLSAVAHLDQIFAFGGTSNGYRMTLQQSLNDIFRLDTARREITTVKCKGTIVPQARRNHTSCMVGSDMVVFGGLNGNNQVLDDFFVFNIEFLAWRKLKVDLPSSLNKLARYGHSMVLVKSETFEFRDILKGEEIEESVTQRNNRKAKHPFKNGLLVFGGCLGPSEYSDDLLFVELGTAGQYQNLQMVETSGRRPSGRAFHSMTFVASECTVIVYGG